MYEGDFAAPAAVELRRLFPGVAAWEAAARERRLVKCVRAIPPGSRCR
jgi:hypothetical protein